MALFRVSLFSLLVGIALLSACRSAQPDTAASSTPAAPLRNTRWVLRTLADVRITTPDKAKEPYLQFDAGTQRLKGQAACNSFFGQFAQSGSTGLQLTNLGATRMFCDRMSLETQYLQALQQTSRFQITGDTLRLYADSSDKVLATFEAVYLR